MSENTSLVQFLGNVVQVADADIVLNGFFTQDPLSQIELVVPLTDVRRVYNGTIAVEEVFIITLQEGDEKKDATLIAMELFDPKTHLPAEYQDYSLAKRPSG